MEETAPHDFDDANDSLKSRSGLSLGHDSKTRNDPSARILSQQGLVASEALSPDDGAQPYEGVDPVIKRNEGETPNDPSTCMFVQQKLIVCEHLSPDDGTQPDRLLEPRIIGRKPSLRQKKSPLLQQASVIARSPTFWGFLAAMFVLVALIAFGAITVADHITGRYGPKPYVSALYHFKVPDISGYDIQADSSGIEVQCKGVFLRESVCHPTNLAVCDELRICFLGVSDRATVGPEKWLADRVKVITNTLALDVQLGLPKLCSLGNEQVPGREMTIEGKIRETGRPVKWHVIVGMVRGRAYAVETICRSQNCERLVPALQNISTGLRFDPDVVTYDSPAAENR
jgi:hypothetical protein